MPEFSERDRLSLPLDCAVQVVGFGISGLGLAFAADRQCQFEKLCQHGLVYIDKRRESDFSSLNFDILSNSPASDFIEGIRPGGLFSALLNSQNGKRLRCLKNKETPLTLVSEFFADAADCLSTLLKPYLRSSVLSRKCVSTIKINRDNTTSSYDMDGNLLVRSRYTVIATGGVEANNSEFASVARQRLADLVQSEPILRGLMDNRLKQIISTGQQIAIIGGSHSAFSVVDYLLRNFSSIIQREQILLVHRSPIKRYYKNIKDFNKTSASKEEGLVDFETQTVNRYSGLRCDARFNYENILNGNENRVNIVSAADATIENLLAANANPVGMLVQATGYHSQMPTIIDHNHQPIATKCTGGQTELSLNHHLISENKQVLESIFGIGLGTFIASAAPYSTTGEVAVGVNIYHQKDADTIISQILGQLGNEPLLPLAQN
ncbi:MAG: hypothetical protein AAFZ92_08370, partial [Pseudomonadota bacterium]